MAGLGANPTLTDIAKTLDPNGRPARMIHILSQSNPILQDMPFMPTNMSTTHQTSTVVSLPTASVRGYNEGTSPSKETAAQQVEDTSMVEIWSEVDRKLAELATDVGAYRLQRATSYIEALNQKMAGLLFYGNKATNSKEFNGFATRYNSTSNANGDNVILGGGAGSDNTSIWLIGWGQGKVMGLYPKNSSAGMAHEDKGIVTRQDVVGQALTLQDVYRDLWMWDFGVSIEDWRYAVRIANIDNSLLKAMGGSEANLSDLMIQAEGSIPFPETANLIWYMARSTFTHFTRLRRNQVSTGGGLTFENVDGKIMPHFNGRPIRVVDQLTIAEATIS